MIRNLSVSGALVRVSGEVAAGERVELHLYLRGDDAPTLAAGHVVRCERRPSGVIWLFELAIEFDVPLANLEAEIAQVAARQAELGEP